MPTHIYGLPLSRTVPEKNQDAPTALPPSRADRGTVTHTHASRTRDCAGRRAHYRCRNRLIRQPATSRRSGERRRHTARLHNRRCWSIYHQRRTGGTIHCYRPTTWVPPCVGHADRRGRRCRDCQLPVERGRTDARRSRDDWSCRSDRRKAGSVHSRPRGCGECSGSSNECPRDNPGQDCGSDSRTERPAWERHEYPSSLADQHQQVDLSADCRGRCDPVE